MTRLLSSRAAKIVGAGFGLAAVAATGVGLAPTLQARLRQKSDDARAARDLPLGTLASGATLVPSNQFVTPVGKTLPQEGTRPKDLALSPDGETLAVLCQNRVVLYQVSDGVLIKTLPLSAAAAPLGIAWSPSGQTVYASLASGKIAKIARSAAGGWQKAGDITVDTVGAPGEADIAAGLAGRGRSLGDPQVNGLAISPDGARLYAALGIKNAVAVLDTQTEKVARVVPVGIAPYHLALSPDGKTLTAACRGGIVGKADEVTEPSAGTLVRVNKENDSAQSGAVAFVSTEVLAAPAKIVPVGRQPGGMAFTADGKTLYVTGEDDDKVYVLDAATGKISKTFALHPTPDFGVIPNSVALADNGKTLLVSCGGANAVAVLAAQTGAVRGWVPTGWFPIAVQERNGALFVASSKGLGNRVARPVNAKAGDDEEKDDNPTATKPVPEGKSATKAYGVHNTLGMVQIVAPADWKDLPKLSGRVAQNNRWADAQEGVPRKDMAAVPVPARVGEPSVFEHVVYIIKENHTYDDDFGDMKEGNGDPSLCLFGEAVTPNEHKLAREFVLLDNTYTSGTNSADGHQWTDSAIANGYMEHNYSAAARSYPYDGGDPLAYSPRGFLWNSAVKAGKSVRVFGEFVNKAHVTRKNGRKGAVKWAEAWADYQNKTDQIDIRSETDSLALRPYLHPRAIGFPLTVSDQWRADQFLGDLDEWEKSGAMPALSIMLLPANHTSGTTPGAPTPRAAVADNDLALGRIVERLSASRFWKTTIILVIEDDSQLGLDHVDGHRTVAFCISPYTRRHAVVHDNYNHTSFLRTIGLVLGLPPMTRFDQSATPLTNCFTPTPNFAKYEAIYTNAATLNTLNPPVAVLRGRAKVLAQQSAAQNLTELDRADASVLTRAAWSLQKPTVPFPTARYNPPPDDEDDQQDKKNENND